jgi:hypothetical protein
LGKVGYLEVDFWHTHNGRHHLHDALVAASIQAHQLAHRLAPYELARWVNVYRSASSGTSAVAGVVG